MADGMRRPLIETAHRPSRIVLRDDLLWREILPHLEKHKPDLGCREQWEMGCGDFGIAHVISLVMESGRSGRAILLWLMTKGMITACLEPRAGVVTSITTFEPSWPDERTLSATEPYFDLTASVIVSKVGSLLSALDSAAPGGSSRSS